MFRLLIEQMGRPARAGERKELFSGPTELLGGPRKEYVVSFPFHLMSEPRPVVCRYYR